MGDTPLLSPPILQEQLKEDKAKLIHTMIDEEIEESHSVISMSDKNDFLQKEMAGKNQLVTLMKSTSSVKAAPHQSGILSIPDEDPPNNCKKCCWCLCFIPYYTFCCCLCWKKKEFSAAKPDFVTRFTRWIPNAKTLGVGGGGPIKDKDQDPIPCLIKLYSC